MNVAPDDPRQEAEAWLQLAREDLMSARTLLENQTQGLRNAAFLAQQAAEKALKALLIAADLPVPRVHNLGALAASLPVDSEQIDDEALAALTPWAVGGRYGAGEPAVSPREASRLIALADSVVEICRALLADVPPTPDGPGQA